ncbi:MAG: hypothetical protein HPM95_12015 [Alphaproteobacteria bacterium]|nr:hypothetical protein [Alphaproteobacteria bacterium]
MVSRDRLSGGLGSAGVVVTQNRNEYGQGLDGNSSVALHPRYSPVDLVEPLGGRRLLPLGGIGRQERSDACFRDQREDCRAGRHAPRAPS